MTTRVTRRRLAAAVLGVASVAAVTVGATSALFTDSDSIANNIVTVGSINLVADQAAVGAFNVPAMMPGDSAYKAFTMANTGTMPLRYSMLSTKTAGSDPLAAALDLDVKTVAAVGNCNAAGWAGATAVSGPLDFASLAGVKVIGDAAQGQTAAAGAVGADRVLANGANEILCVRVTLPSTDTASQGLTATATFLFNSEQTQNNP